MPDSSSSSSPHWQIVHQLENALSQSIIGQKKLVNRMLISLLADGHLLVEGAPGLAKTRAIKSLADFIEGDFHRIQFTPDLLPADITGTEIYRPENGTFEFQPGPIFHHLILADEINRAPAKVQSALLEAMAERQISVGKTTHHLPSLFMVMATQNPIEQAGTYPLPEAQLDRFLMHVNVDYPDVKAEQNILQLTRFEAQHQHNTDSINQNRPVISQDTLFEVRHEVLNLHMIPEIERYIVEIIIATRHPERYDTEIAKYIQYGASPRGTIALDKCARAHAWLAGRTYVTPEDVQAVVFDVLRHRFSVNFEAEAQGITTNQMIAQLMNLVAAP